MRYFYDIGANIGQTFDWYLLKRADLSDCHVVCFEPSVRHVPSLLKKMRTSIVGKFPSLTVVTAALAGSNGVADLYEKTTQLSDSLYKEHINNIVKNADRSVAIQVPTIRISDYMREHTRPGDDVLMKIDAEGGEFAILNDLLSAPSLLSRIKLLLVEWHYGKFPEQPGMDRAAASVLTSRLTALGVTPQPWKF